MLDLQQQLRDASDWKAYVNVVKQCEKRGYYVPEVFKRAEHMHALEFAKEFIVPDIHQALLLPAQCMVVSKIDPKLITPALAAQTDSAVLPDITATISTVLSTAAAFEKDSKDNEPQDSLTLQVVNGRRHLCILTPAGDDCIYLPLLREDEMLILFVRKYTKALGKEAIVQILKYTQLMKCQNLMLIADNCTDPSDVMSTVGMKTFKSDGKEIFARQKKRYDPTATVFHGEFEVYDPARADVWLKNHHLKRENMENMTDHDALTQYYGFKKNDFVQIHEKGGTSRFVVVGVNK